MNGIFTQIMRRCCPFRGVFFGEADDTYRDKLSHQMVKILKYIEIAMINHREWWMDFRNCNVRRLRDTLNRTIHDKKTQSLVPISASPVSFLKWSATSPLIVYSNCKSVLSIIGIIKKEHSTHVRNNFKWKMQLNWLPFQGTQNVIVFPSETSEWQFNQLPIQQ